jgi:hypothetical protein
VSEGGPISPLRLGYQRPETLADPNRQRVRVVVICTFYGLLALPLFALGVGLGILLIHSIITEPYNDQARPRWVALGLSILFFFGLGMMLVYWIWWYIRSLSSRGQ